MDGRHQQFASVRSIPGNRSNRVLCMFWRAPAISQCRSGVWECFFARNRLEEGKGEGTSDDIYWIESVKEGDQDQDGNAFEIFDDEKSEHAM